jgi:hypothetical protein
MENVCKIYYHLEYFTAIWYNLWPFGIVCDHLVYFSILGQEKSGNPDVNGPLVSKLGGCVSGLPYFFGAS